MSVESSSSLAEYLETRYLDFFNCDERMVEMEQVELPTPKGHIIAEGSDVWCWKEFQDLVALWKVSLELDDLRGVEFYLHCERRAAITIRHEETLDINALPSERSGFDVYHSPQFIAFAKRIGFPLEQLVLDVTIRCYHGEPLKWIASVHGVDTHIVTVKEVVEKTTIGQETDSVCGDYSKHQEELARMYDEMSDTRKKTSFY